MKIEKERLGNFLGAIIEEMEK